MVLSEYEVRKQKAETLRSLGINPYAQKYDKQYMINDLLSKEGGNFRDVEEIIPAPKSDYKTAGRLTLFRSHGKLSFGKLLDESGEIQIMFHKDNCKLMTNEQLRITNTNDTESGDMTPYKILEKLVDVGDFIGVEGELFITHKGELTLFVSNYSFLVKAIRPLGDKFHGIGDDQERAYRQRYLDMIFNRETMERMKLRSNFMRVLRQFYWSHGFMEVDCPILTPAASGAAAKPFITHHNDFDTDFYLRICNETELKKATVGGLEKVFTIGVDFRNEGSDPSHLQEFTMLEHQNVYRSYHEDMRFTEEMFEYIFTNLNLDRKIMVKDKLGNAKEVNFTTPWPKIDYVDGVNKASGLDITKYGIDDADKLRKDIRAKGHEFEGMDHMGTMTLIDYLYKKVLRPSIIGPAFIYNYPRIIAPLARISDEDPNKCEKWQVVVNGWEIINSYGELVDPVKQQANFDEQAKAEAGGDAEATSADANFVLAMEYGMPIQAGFGMGLDRILALITGQDNLKDVIMFPLMKPLISNSESKIQNSELHKEKEGGISENVAERAVSYEGMPSVKESQALADKYLTETRNHCEQVGKIMQYFAKKLGQDEDVWYIAGLLHDVDWDHIGKDADNHLGDEFHKIAKEINMPQALIDDIRSHYHEKTGVPVDLLIRRYLASVDELSGFLYAYSLMRPEGFVGMEVKSVMKKIKDSKFAAGVSREHVRNCETFLNIPLEEFIPQVIEAMIG